MLVHSLHEESFAVCAEKSEAVSIVPAMQIPPLGVSQISLLVARWTA